MAPWLSLKNYPGPQVSMSKLLGFKAYPSLRFFRWGRHKLFDHFKNELNLFIMFAKFALEFVKLGGKFSLKMHDLTETHKCPHDGDVDLNGSWASENPREHCDTFLSEGFRQVASASMTST